jgi:excisionase family DNA binding protein
MLTTRQVAVLLGLNRDWVIELCRTGKLRALQIEGRWFIKDEDVHAYRQKRLDRPDASGVG